MKKNLLILFVLFGITLYAHSGRTNSDGCHNKKSDGTYHCHIL